MLSPKGIGPLMRSRVIGMSSERVQAHFSWDEPEPDYRVNIEYLGRLEDRCERNCYKKTL